MSAKRALTDIAYDVMKENREAMTFKSIWENVTAISGVNASEISQFYTDMMLDSRFVNLKANMWDLKRNRTFAETFVDLEQLDLDDEDEEENCYEDESEDLLENKEEDE